MKVVILTPDNVTKEGARAITSVPYPFIDLCMDAWHKDYGLSVVAHQNETLVDKHIAKWCVKNKVQQLRWSNFWLDSNEDDRYIRDLQLIRWEQPDYILAFQPMSKNDDRVEAGVDLAKRQEMNVKILNGNYIYDLSLLPN